MKIVYFSIVLKMGSLQHDHIHVAFSLHPKNALSDLVKDIKVASSIMLKENGVSPKFTGWQNGYGVLFLSPFMAQWLMVYYDLKYLFDRLSIEKAKLNCGVFVDTKSL